MLKTRSRSARSTGLPTTVALTSTALFRRDEVAETSDHAYPEVLLRDGRYAPLVAGSRTVSFDPATRWIRTIHLEAVDALERTLVADGELVGRHGLTGPSGTGH